MNKRLVRIFSVLIVVLTSFGQVLTPAVHASPANQALCTITGIAFRDFNADALQGQFEPPVEGIQVQATDAAGAVVGTTLTGADGTYSLDVPEGVEVRIAFGNVPAFLRFGPDGAETSPGVTFETCTAGSAPVNVGLANPGQHCDLNPDVFTSCFALGDQINGPNSGDDVLLSVPFTAGSADLAAPSSGRFDAPAHTNLAAANQIGSTYGLGYVRQSQTLYAAAFVKRHAGLGPSGPGAIYQVSLAGGAPSLFTTLTAAPAGEAIHTSGTAIADWLRDAESYDLVGKRGLGDVTVSDDDSTLYVVNLFDRLLYSIPVDNPGGQSTFNIPTGGCSSGADARPFAVEYYDGLVYVGVTCSAEASQNPANLQGLIYALNPAGGGFSQVLSFPFNYDRRCADAANDPDCVTDFPADWLPWTSTFPTINLVGTAPTSVTYPQPWLTDIEFDNNGDMILGIRDRFGDQSGNEAFSPDLTDTENYLGFSAGDILRACRTGASSWSIENNGSCGGVTTAGSGAGEGPGGGEFYFQDNLVDFHDEDAWGSLLQVPGQPDVLGTYFDPIPINSELFDAGFRWTNNTTGTTTRAYRVYNGVPGSLDLFGKVNGLGGMEMACPPAPIEIGNRVWLDLDQDGEQDPGETPVAGVTVRLYDGAGALIAETVTNADGEYLFTSLADGVLFNTDYVVRLDNPADFETGGALFEWFLTNAGSSADNIDSDGVLVGGFPSIDLTTGDPGDNNHTYDFGFVLDPTLPTPTPSPTSTPDGNNPPGGDPPGSGNPPVNPNNPSIVIAQASGPISIIKTASPPFAQIGDTVVWTITVTNNTSDPVADVTVTDTIPNGMTIVNVSSTAGSPSVSGQNISLTIPSLGPGDQVVITITTRINSGPNVPLIFRNSATVSSVLGELTASAQVVRASQLVQTGETPWWRNALIAASLALLVGGMSYGLLQRRR